MKQNATFGRRVFLSVFKSVISCSPTPSQGLGWFIFGNYFLNRILTDRLKLKDQ